MAKTMLALFAIFFVLVISLFFVHYADRHKREDGQSSSSDDVRPGQ